MPVQSITVDHGRRADRIVIAFGIKTLENKKNKLFISQIFIRQHVSPRLISEPRPLRESCNLFGSYRAVFHVAQLSCYAYRVLIGVTQLALKIVRYHEEKRKNIVILNALPIRGRRYVDNYGVCHRGD